MGPWFHRAHYAFPFQTWHHRLPPEAIVQVKNTYGDSRIGQVKDFWWGYDKDNPEGVITEVRRLDRPRVNHNRMSALILTRRLEHVI